MVPIHLAYKGDLRVEAIHGPSKVTLITDAPVDNHGKGESFSPTDLVATALGACMMTIMGIVAERHEIDLAGTEIYVEKHMVSEPARRIGKLKVAFKVLTEISPDHKKRLIRAAQTCPVHHSLHPDIKLDLQFLWDADGTSDRLLG